jgi:glyceraldehyde-3-phosphate dehydrogenase/erythrose-4-phosphate dehydrogenase
MQSCTAKINNAVMHGREALQPQLMCAADNEFGYASRITDLIAHMAAVEAKTT